MVLIVAGNLSLSFVKMVRGTGVEPVAFGFGG